MPTVEIIETQFKPKFSFGYALLGPFAYFFHRKQIRQDLPFWKCAGVDMFVWAWLLGIVNRITSVLMDSNTVLSIVQMVGMMTMWGFVGAWRFNRFKRIDCDRPTYSRRDWFASLVGVIVMMLLYTSSYIISKELPYIPESTQQTTYSSDYRNTTHRQTHYWESGYICEKFFQLSGHIDVSTNAKVSDAVHRIHTYCPGDDIVRDTVSEVEIVNTVPQLKTWDWNEDFIHSYATKDGKTAYIYIRKIR